jgi:hypothetical protein
MRADLVARALADFVTGLALRKQTLAGRIGLILGER